jgi:tRNA(Ile)-lysidine synthase
MKDLILYNVKEFLKENYRTDKPLLLGFSGGPDSLALLYLLLECKRFFPALDIHLAHVDHRWRPESSKQALALRDLAFRLNLPFYLHTLSERDEKESNAEAKARDARLNFFKRLSLQNSYQAVVLAHQRDDQAETILKRVFEGASLFSLGGLRPLSELFGMNIWRPLLKVSKKEIINWLEERGLSPLDDETNRDVKYLRSRMRVQIFPKIADLFGKQISHNLCYLADCANDLKAYFNKKTALLFGQMIEGPFGSCLDFNPFFPLERMELKAFFKNLAERQEILLSREHLGLLEESILTKAANRWLNLKKKHFFLDRGFLFILDGSMPEFCSRDVLGSQKILRNGWQWEVSQETVEKNLKPSSWQDVWLGTAKVVLPKDNYELAPPEPNAPFPRSAPIKKWWTNHYIPTIMRTVFPLICKKGAVVHEFLTGKSLLSFAKSSVLISINIKRSEPKNRVEKTS